MFISAVKSTSHRARFDKDSHQMNGLILGPKEAIFLAAFLTSLHKSYSEAVETVSEEESPAFNKEIFENVLKDKLDEYGQDDSDNFGR